MQSIAAYFQDFTPNCEYCGAGVAYPVIEVYKNGKRVDGMIMVRIKRHKNKLKRTKIT